MTPYSHICKALPRNLFLATCPVKGKQTHAHTVEPSTRKLKCVTIHVDRGLSGPDIIRGIVNRV